jgi:hypothetical protein
MIQSNWVKMEQILECLLAGHEEMKAILKAGYEEMKAH